MLLKNTTFIYTLVDPITKEVRYVGKANNPWKRLYQHLLDRNLKRKNHKNDWIKFLLERKLNPLIQILEQCSISKWEEREKDWIVFYTKIGCKLTNATDGGEGASSGEKNTSKKLEVRTKIRNSLLGRKHSDESKKKMSKARRGKKFKPHSKKTKEKIRQSILTFNSSHLDRYVGIFRCKRTEETKNKIRQSVLKQVELDKSKFTKRWD